MEAKYLWGVKVFASIAFALSVSICGVFFLGGGERAAPWIDVRRIQEVDLIFRSDEEAVSVAIRTLSQGAWSHVGVLFNGGGDDKWMVIHAMPEESESRRSGVIVEPLHDFMKNAKEVGVYRHRKIRPNIKLPSQIISREVSRTFGITEESTYCTKLAIDILGEVGLITNPKVHSFSLFGQSHSIVLPQALADANELQRIF